MSPFTGAAEKWDRWLTAVGATITEEGKTNGVVTRRCYELRDARGGKWVLILNVLPDGRLSLCIWAPDGLQIVVPDEPSWEALRASTRICQRCGRAADSVGRVGFAGRWCQLCLDLHRGEVEYPGWTE